MTDKMRTKEEQERLFREHFTTGRPVPGWEGVPVIPVSVNPYLNREGIVPAHGRGLTVDVVLADGEDEVHEYVPGHTSRLAAFRRYHEKPMSEADWEASCAAQRSEDEEGAR